MGIQRDDIIRRWNDTTSWRVLGFGEGMRVQDVNDPAYVCIFPLGGTHDEQGRLMPYGIVERAGKPNSVERQRALNKAYSEACELDNS